MFVLLYKSRVSTQLEYATSIWHLYKKDIIAIENVQRSCLYGVCMYWTRLVLVRPRDSLYSSSPLKQHATGRQ